MPRKVMLGAAIRPVLLDRIRAIAATENRSVSAWVEARLLEFVQEYESKNQGGNIQD